MTKRIYQLLFSMILLFTIASPVFAEGSSQNISIYSDSFKQANLEYNEIKKASYEQEINIIKAKIADFPEDSILQEAKKYLTVSPKLEGISSLGYYSVDIVLFDKNGGTQSLEDYLNKLESEKSTRSLGLVQPAASGGVVFINYMNGNISNKEVEHTIEYTADLGSVPDQVSVTNTLYYDTYKGGTYSSAKVVSNRWMKKGNKLTASVRATTKYWKGQLSSVITDNGGVAGTYSKQTEPSLYNNAAMPYYEYVDSHSGKVNIEPASTTWIPVSNPVAWTNTDRGNYISWYISTYGNPGWTWADYDIHHIKPREYGGTNSNSNLIPVPRLVHQLLITAWWNSYNKG